MRAEDVENVLDALKNDALLIISEANIINLIIECRKILRNEDMLLRASGNFVIFGDIHGHFFEFLGMMDGLEPHRNVDMDASINSETKFIFLGDYVDRGQKSVECILYLMAMKILYPDRYFLLRGNHEEAIMNVQDNGFYSNCKNTFGARIFAEITMTYSYMSVAIILNDTIFCVHGGISPILNDVNELNNIEKPTNIDGVILDLLWSDYRDDVDTFEDNYDRGCAYFYGIKAIDNFLDQNSLTCIIRGHEFFSDGFSNMADGRVISIFSAGNYIPGIENTPAVITIDFVDDKNIFSIISFSLKPDPPYSEDEIDNELSIDVPIDNSLSIFDELKNILGINNWE